MITPDDVRTVREIASRTLANPGRRAARARMAESLAAWDNACRSGGPAEICDRLKEAYRESRVAAGYPAEWGEIDA